MEAPVRALLDTADELDAVPRQERMARVLSMAGNEFNLGLRSYYFALGTLTWFINPLLFILTVAGVVVVLYRREFHSDVLHIMMFSPAPIPPSAQMEKTE